MTDNEIIKALECCMFITPDKKCNECPKDNEGVECAVVLHGQALDLINRQKAEIEEAIKRITFLRMDVKKYKTEIERLKNSESTYRSCYETLTDMYETAKSEAIKEFAEEVKKYRCVMGCGYDVVDVVDKLVKEMTE